MTRVLVISNDFQLKNGVADELSKVRDYEVISTAFSVAQAARLLDVRGANVIIVDLAGQDATSAALKSLMDRYNLLVIIMGSHPGISYVMSGINNILPKPISGNRFSTKSFCEEVARRIHAFSTGTLNVPAGVTAGPGATVAINPQDLQTAAAPNQKIVVIAASTGGTEALPIVMRDLPANMPPMLIVQHMPAMFTKQFAERLDKLSRVRVKEAADGDYLQKNMALLAPGDLHMRLVKKNQKLAVEVFMGEKMHGVRPAADITFNSVLGICGGNVVGAILTGMGADGARGLFELHAKGAKIIAQNKETCIVYGMPKVAVDLGAADYVLPLTEIGRKLAELC